MTQEVDLDAVVEDGIIFSDEQNAAIQKTINWYTNVQQGAADTPQIFQFTGYAGTGKTTCIQEIIRLLGLRFVRFGAYTGKAALVMKKTSGVNAQTIHSLIYKLVKEDKEALDRLQKELDESNDDRERDRIFKEIQEKSKPHFQLNYKDSPLIGAELLVLDECSMVDAELLKDLKSFRVPIIALGDPGQLPPVKGTGALFIGNVDVKLEQIHRQAEGNPIIDAATRARSLIPWVTTHPEEHDGFNHYGMNSVPTSVIEALYVTSDQILCGMHKTRKAVNQSVRRLLKLGASDPFPVEGDRVICRRNDRSEGLFNGLQAEVISRIEVYNDYVEYMVQTEIGEAPQKVQMHRAPFEEYYDPDARKNYGYWTFSDYLEWDYAYCLTVHVAQGSQWDKVLLIDDGFLKGWGRTQEEKNIKRVERGKWLYTAVTRAAKEFTCLK